MSDSKQAEAQLPLDGGQSKSSKGRLLFGANVMRGYRVEIQVEIKSKGSDVDRSAAAFHQSS